MANFAQYIILIEKILIISGSIVYFIFALIVLRQANIMTRKIFDLFNPTIKTMAFVHLIAAGFLVFLTLTLL